MKTETPQFTDEEKRNWNKKFFREVCVMHLATASIILHGNANQWRNLGRKIRNEYERKHYFEIAKENDEMAKTIRDHLKNNGINITENKRKT